MQERSDDELIQEYQKEVDIRYLSEVFLRHADSVYRVALQFTGGNTADAEDVVQVTFIKFVQNYQQYQGGTNLKAWLNRIAINLCRDKHREEKQRRVRQEKQAATAPYYTEASEKLETAELQETIKLSLQKLPERYRTPMWMILYEGFSYSEVSSILELPERTIRTQVSRGTEKLRELLSSNHIRLNGSVVISLISTSKLDVLPMSTKAIIQSPQVVNLISNHLKTSFKESQRIAASSSSAKGLSVIVKLTFLLMTSLVVVGGYFLIRMDASPKVEQKILTQESEASKPQEFSLEWDFIKENEREQVIFIGEWEWLESFHIMLPQARKINWIVLPITLSDKMLEMTITQTVLPLKEKKPTDTYTEYMGWGLNKTALPQKYTSAGDKEEIVNIQVPFTTKYYIYQNYIYRSGGRHLLWQYQEIPAKATIHLASKNMGIRKITVKYLEKPNSIMLNAIEESKSPHQKWISSSIAIDMQSQTIGLKTVE